MRKPLAETIPAHLWTADDIAALLGVKAGAVVRSAKAGEIPHVQFGSTFYFDPGKVEAWMNGQEYEDEADAVQVQVCIQLKTGRWAALILCPDGVERWFATEGMARPGARRQREVPLGIRFEILKRDDFTCRYCGRKAPDVTLHVDHVIAVANGGTTDPDNLVTACSECNSGKGAR